MYSLVQHYLSVTFSFGFTSLSGILLQVELDLQKENNWISFHKQTPEGRDASVYAGSWTPVLIIQVLLLVS